MRVADATAHRRRRSVAQQTRVVGRRGASALLAEASRIFSVEDDAARERGNELLLMVERLLREEAAAREEKARARSPEGSPGRSRDPSRKPRRRRRRRRTRDEIDESENVSEASESADDVRVFLGKLAELTSSGQRAAADTLARVLPRLAAADAAATERARASRRRVRRATTPTRRDARGARRERARVGAAMFVARRRGNRGRRLRREVDRVCYAGRAPRRRGVPPRRSLRRARRARARDKNSREWTGQRARDPPCRAGARRASRILPMSSRDGEGGVEGEGGHERGQAPRRRRREAGRSEHAWRARRPGTGTFPGTGTRRFWSCCTRWSPRRNTASERPRRTRWRRWRRRTTTRASRWRRCGAPLARRACEKRWNDASGCSARWVSPDSVPRAETLSAAFRLGRATPRSSSTPPNSTPTGSLGSWPASPSPGRASDLLAVAVSPGSMLGFEDFVGRGG